MGRGFGTLVPGYGVRDQDAVRACGSMNEFRRRVDIYTQMHYDARDDGTGPIEMRPKIGQSECDVLAMLGAPDDSAVVETASSRSQVWTYFTGYRATRSAHLVTLEERGPEWVVTSLTW